MATRADVEQLCLWEMTDFLVKNLPSTADSDVAADTFMGQPYFWISPAKYP